MRCLGIGAGDAKGVWRTRVPTRETMCCQTKSMCHVAIVITRWAASVVGADAVGVVLVLCVVVGVDGGGGAAMGACGCDC